MYVGRGVPGIQEGVVYRVYGEDPTVCVCGGGGTWNTRGGSV